MRKEIKGVGITAQEWEHPDTPEEKKASRRAAVEAWRAGGSGFEVVVAPYEKWALGQLAAFGFKDIAAFREKDPIIGDSLGDRALHYAVQVLRYIQIVRKAITDNNAQEAARFAISIGEKFALIQATLEWEKFALHGKNVAESKRSLSRLYREAAAILERKGADLSAKLVRRELERGRVIRVKLEVLYWNDDRGVKHKTTAKQFASRLGGLREQFR